MTKQNDKRFLLSCLALAAVGGPAAAFAGVSAQGVSAQGVSAQGVSAQGVSAQGVSAQGVSAQGVSAQGVSAQGVSAQGVSAQGVSAQGVSAQGVSAQGVSAQGVSAQGVSAQGVSAQGVSAQGKALFGTDLTAIDGRAVEITSVKLRGTTPASGLETYTLTNIPMMSMGPGNYIAPTTGGGAAGHYAVAHTIAADGTAAEDIDLFIASEEKDPLPNLFHRYEEQDNQDELYVVYFFHKWSGQWASLCPYNQATKSASAMALPVDDPMDPHRFIFACTATGVASKCARNWGYKPWGETQTWEYDATANGGLGAWSLQPRALKPYYEICVAATQAAYCQDGRSYTKNGTMVDLFDTRQIVWPNAIENPFSLSNPDSLWMMAQEYFISQGTTPPTIPSMKDSALQRSRYKELSPASECANFAYIDRLEHDHIEDGRWAAPLANTPRLQVFSPTYCNHDETQPGDPLPWDCSPCTTEVCKTMPECCGAGPLGWNLTCVGHAATVCQTGGVAWPKGKVWPRDLPDDDKSVYPLYLLGPQGAVLRADGVSDSGSSATISGWACDPEWAGASVVIEVYAGGPAGDGGTLLGQLRADQPLAAPLAREVSAACDGPGRTYARHGFSFTLPVNQSGDVYVYARDDSTANGPAAPATLIRNGVVRVPRCAHSEHVAGEALSATCSTCAAAVCGDEAYADCCTTAWTDACAAAADTCAPADTSALANSRTFAAVTTGWIEAPATGNYVFEASQQPSRLLINGTKILDWFENSAGTTSGSITLSVGQKYHLRWDRLQAEPPSGPGQGVTWQVPGTVGQAPIPTANLYALAPVSPTGLSVTYFMTSSFGGATVTRTDANIDINKDIAPPGATPVDLPSGYGPSYSARWEGEIVPSFTEDHTFYVVGSGSPALTINGNPVSFLPTPPSVAPGAGCAHDACTLGPKLDASCDTCVAAICANDPFCCNGGYLSYYSFEPVWDAKCIADVAAYCPGSRCTAPLPTPPGSPQIKSAVVALQAGVHYRMMFEYKNPSTDKTVRLLWSSPRQAKQAVPEYAFRPLTAVAAAVGSGLNVTYFATGQVGDTIVPNLNVPFTGGVVTDFSLTPSIGQLGVPAVEVVLASPDPSSGRPSPPTIVRPRYGEEVFYDGVEPIHITGVGGIKDGWVRVIGGSAGDVIVPVSSTGTFDAPVPLGTGPHELKLAQYTFEPSGVCAPPNPCTRSTAIGWPITVTLETASSKPPEILTPSDPTHSPATVPTAFNFVGRGTTGNVDVEDQAQIIPAALGTFIPTAEGKFTGHITLQAGNAVDPLKGWHKVVFKQGATSSRPVFISVGIDPPTVEFPRNGAQLPCGQDDQSSPPPATGTIPYPVDERFGPLHVLEETGREGLRDFGAKITMRPPAQQGGPDRFEVAYDGAGPGRHVLLFFQAPVLPQDTPQAVKDAHLRAFSSLANTPTSRIVVDIKPRRFQIPAGLAAVVGGLRGGFPGTSTNVPPPGQQGPFLLGASDCANVQQTPSILCALPFADVNIRIGGRLETKRADADGNWSMPLPLALGWNTVTLAQATDSRVGGAWSESCESNEVELGVRDPGGPTINVPADITVDATSPKGAQVFYQDVTAFRATDGAAVPVTCVPPSGSIFHVGRNAVLCTATDPDTGKVGLGEFAITVVDGPPQISATDVTLEADSPLGANLNAYSNVTVFDVVDPSPALSCVPAAPHFFLLDQIMPVVCTATDDTNLSASAEFKVRVVDTTPPVLCELPDIKVASDASGGAIVKFNPCAKDIVDGPVEVVCDPRSGSFFPVGKTKVTCAAVDKHGNKSAPSSFIVDVGDSTPPVLKLPGTVNATATSRSGARVNFTVIATDNVDPKPTVKCTPPSGSLFPLGTTTVNCTATDAAGNTSSGGFKVKVTVAWGGLLHPVDGDGSSRFLLGLPIGLRFALTGASANIWDLQAKLFVAPLNAAGQPGAERPAAGLPPGAGNLFYFIPIINQYAMLLDTRPLSVGPWQLRVDPANTEIYTERITMFRLF